MSQLNAQFNAAQVSGGGFTPVPPTIALLERAPTSLTVQTSAYVGPASHSSTTLQAQLAGGDWSVLVFEEVRTSGDLRLFHIPDLVSSTDYELRALHASSNGTASAFGATLEARTKGTLAEFQQTDLLFLMETPIAGENENDVPARWPDTGPFADIGLAAVGDPRYRTDGPCTGLDVVEFDGTDYYSDSVAGPSSIPNRVGGTLGTNGDFTLIQALRRDGPSTNTTFGCFTFGGDNILLFQVRSGPDRFRIIGPGLDVSLEYTPRGSGDLDVFVVTYVESTRVIKVWHYHDLIGQGTFSSPVAFGNTHWVEVGDDLDPSGPSELLVGVSALTALWHQAMSDGAREDNTDFAGDNFTCGGSPGGGGGGGCVPPIVTFENAIVATGGPRVDIKLLGSPPDNHTQSRYRIRRASDDVVVFPTSGTGWHEPGVGLSLLGITISLRFPEDVGIPLYAEAEWFDGDAMTWCGVGESSEFTIEEVENLSDRTDSIVTVRETASPR